MDSLYSLIPLAALLIVCDLPWLYAMAESNQAMIKKIQGGAPLQIRWEGAPIVYLALAFLVQRAKSTVEAGLIGLCTYAVYDFTNYTALIKYDLNIAIADSLWGGALFMIVRSLAIYFNIL